MCNFASCEIRLPLLIHNRPITDLFGEHDENISVLNIKRCKSIVYEVNIKKMERGENGHFDNVALLLWRRLRLNKRLWINHCPG